MHCSDFCVLPLPAVCLRMGHIVCCVLVVTCPRYYPRPTPSRAAEHALDPVAGSLLWHVAPSRDLEVLTVENFRPPRIPDG